ncbi:MAG: DUF2514 domain-containing protein [Burkholderiaceae bacterium]|nr:DUF2514 domain-containing protein [Burkholderiaceae bacterium]
MTYAITMAADRTRLLLGAIATCAALALCAYLFFAGQARGERIVQARWDAAEERRRADDAQAAMQAAQRQAAAERAARETELQNQATAERIAHDQAARETALRADAERSAARARSLLDTIASLNGAGPAPAHGLPQAAAAAVAGAGPDGAATARNALGECSQRYAAVAATADGLSAQVTGLQAWARMAMDGNGDAATGAAENGSGNGL